MRLPIFDIEEALISSAGHKRQIILQAPTGSGKSTQIPQMLLDNDCLGTGQCVVLQPRRLATRLLSKRIAEERNTELGGEVGYQIRFENRTSKSTRIRLVTEGVLVRQLLGEPDLNGISALVFDEFHERHIEGDIALALAKQLQATKRPDLLIVVMSATLETGILKNYLPDSDIITTKGRTFPVEISYQPLGTGNQRPVWEAATEAFRKWSQESKSGDALIFMPGAFEIRKTIDQLKNDRSTRGWKVLPLYGDLSPEQQDAAVNKYTERKVIVATNVAETSITIDGVTAVIDSGLVRAANFDPHRGINTLLIEKISRASADQRAGRAGRTEPGICMRLWSKTDHEVRQDQEAAEIHRIDLAETLLMLTAAGTKDLEQFDWIEAPTEKSYIRALELLKDLGALEREHLRITPLGKQMVSFPAHPRHARMLITADQYHCVPEVCLAVALSQGKSLLLQSKDKRIDTEREKIWGEEITSDLQVEIQAYHYAEGYRFQTDACRAIAIHAGSARQAGQIGQQLLKLAERQGLSLEQKNTDGTGLRKSILAGFSDQLAKRLDKGTRLCALVHNRRGELHRSTVVIESPLIVAMEINEIQGKDVSVLLGQVSAVEESWLEELFPGDLKESAEVIFNPAIRRVEGLRTKTFRDLVLTTSPDKEPPEEKAAELLAQKVYDGTLTLKKWDSSVENWIMRLNFLAKAMPELEMPSIKDEDRLTLLEHICLGGLGYKDIKDRDPWPTLKAWLSTEQKAALDYFAPERIQISEKRSCKVRYLEEGSPVIAARIQELYDVKTTPSLADGKIPLRLEILAPNQRPVQITDNLETFWTSAYPAIKKELAGRYPKHEWR
ncbi:MAG: ATP-dependent helicase HrpB [Verrucomicrobia bacterium]|nr:ATP-dependent helicase HrpB [Verrucomicrobiota bacterium]MDA1066863.1 ATP-dependent helicase HrpB [Verrucomicrobiota bacterium]